jgi:endonuclease/exonuclease/phosphatase family metal-dependent hydrolase
VRVATFNILHGRSTDDGAVDLGRLREAIQALDPDVLALQEVDRDQPRSHLADLTEVAADAMQAREHRFSAAVSGTPGATWVAATGREQPGTAAYGIALLSRYPVTSWETVRLPRIPVPLPVYLREPGGVHVVREEPRTALVARLESPLGHINVVNTHLSFVPGWNRRQLHLLAKVVRTLEGPVILLGDLNAPPPRPARIIKLAPAAELLTFPAHEPNRQLDHILVRGRLPKVVRAEAVEMSISDHRPLLAEFFMQ